MITVTIQGRDFDAVNFHEVDIMSYFPEGEPNVNGVIQCLSDVFNSEEADALMDRMTVEEIMTLWEEWSRQSNFEFVYKRVYDVVNSLASLGLLVEVKRGAWVWVQEKGTSSEYAMNLRHAVGALREEEATLDGLISSMEKRVKHLRSRTRVSKEDIAKAMPGTHGVVLSSEKGSDASLYANRSRTMLFAVGDCDVHQISDTGARPDATDDLDVLDELDEALLLHDFEWSPAADAVGVACL